MAQGRVGMMSKNSSSGVGTYAWYQSLIQEVHLAMKQSLVYRELSGAMAREVVLNYPNWGITYEPTALIFAEKGMTDEFFQSDNFGELLQQSIQFPVSYNIASYASFSDLCGHSTSFNYALQNNVFRMGLKTCPYALKIALNIPESVDRICGNNTYFLELMQYSTTNQDLFGSSSTLVSRVMRDNNATLVNNYCSIRRVIDRALSLPDTVAAFGQRGNLSQHRNLLNNGNFQAAWGLATTLKQQLPQMTDNITTLGTVMTENLNASQTTTAWRAFDKSDTTYAQIRSLAGSSSPVNDGLTCVTIELPQPMLAVKLRVLIGGYASYGANYTQAYIEASPDGETWSSITTNTNYVTPSGSEAVAWCLNSNTPSKFFRVRFYYSSTSSIYDRYLYEFNVEGF